MKAVQNGAVVPASTKMAELPQGAAGVFETLLRHKGRMLFWDEHWERFAAGARWFGLTLPFSKEGLHRTASDLADTNSLATGVIRYAAWRERHGCRGASKQRGRGH